MRRHPIKIPRWFQLPVLLAAMASGPFAVAQRGPVESEDAYGYVLQRSPAASCPVQWVDLASGTPLTLVAAGAEPANDDGAAELDLTLPFSFYGVEYSRLSVSSNGYLAFLGEERTDDGGQWRADCPLPAVPHNRQASFARVYGLLADLERGASGTLSWDYFDVCPRASSVGDDACTVVQWMDWKRRGATAFFDMQIALYHASGEIVVQYGDVEAAAAAGATIGIQDHGAASAYLASCGTSTALAASSAHCYFDEHVPTSYAVSAIVEPAEGGTVLGTGSYTEGETVELTAVPEPDFVFVFWLEDGEFFSDQSAITFTADAPRQLQANFLPTAEEVFVSGFEGAPAP